jgi:predicted RNase H-like nuclease (RuvC/YqgF family)
VSESEEVRAEDPAREALARLEAAVGRLIDERVRLGLRTRTAEARVRDLEALLRRFTRGDSDPVSLQRRLAEVEAERDELRGRVQEGREGVERLLSRIRFLEEQR